MKYRNKSLASIHIPCYLYRYYFHTSLFHCDIKHMESSHLHVITVWNMLLSFDALCHYKSHSLSFQISYCSSQERRSNAVYFEVACYAIMPINFFNLNFVFLKTKVIRSKNLQDAPVNSQSETKEKEKVTRIPKIHK